MAIFVMYSSVELHPQVTTLSFLSGVVYGSFSHGRREFLQFMADNKHTMFENPRDAQQSMRV